MLYKDWRVDSCRKAKPTPHCRVSHKLYDFMVMRCLPMYDIRKAWRLEIKKTILNFKPSDLNAELNS